MPKRLLTILKLGWSSLVSLVLVTYFFPFGFVFLDFHIWGSFADPGQAYTEFRSLITYLQPPWDTSLNGDFFSIEDVLHMHDVQNVYKLVWTSLIVLSIALIIWRVYAFKTRTKPVAASAPVSRQRKLTLALFALILVFLVLWGWQPVFTAFHQLIFPQNTYWQLDPDTSNLIKYFPDGVFQILSLTWLIVAGLIYLLIKPRYLVDKKLQVVSRPGVSPAQAG